MSSKGRRAAQACAGERADWAKAAASVDDWLNATWQMPSIVDIGSGRDVFT